MSIHFGLDNISKLASLFPPYARPTCHIAGTNGKGSVSALLSSVFFASSLSVGRFTSPHLLAPHDSIAINNEPISPSLYAYTHTEVSEINRLHNVGASLFELHTLVALLIFERAKLDIVVLEVGMGGRLDATNIIPDVAVLVSALTAVDLDHQAFLGPTRAHIAREKAAIARRGKPFVLGPQKYAEVVDNVEDSVRNAGAELVRVGPAESREWDEQLDGPRQTTFSLDPSTFQNPPPNPVVLCIPGLDDDVPVLLPLHGAHQLDNLGLVGGVLSALITHYPVLREKVTHMTVAHGIRGTSWPGRLSFHSFTPSPSARPLIVLADGAHNPASAHTLGSYLTHILSLTRSRPVSVTFILALSHSPPKTPLETLTPLFAPFTSTPALVHLRIAALQFSPPEDMPWVRSVPPSELRAVVPTLALDAEVWTWPEGAGGVEALGEALKWAGEQQGEEHGLVVVAGSLYLVADFYRILNTGL